MDTKHTPAPWKIEWGMTQGGYGHHVIDSRDMGELSIISTIWFNDDGEGETKANARLIAAAPDLFDFASLVSRMTTDSEMGGNMSGDDAAQALSELIETARAAIAKATGSAA